MDQTDPQDRLDAVLRDIRVAAGLVRSGEARSVTVAGLAFGEQLLPAAREIAAQEGVAVEPRWWSDDAGADLVVLPIGGGEAAADA